LKIYAIGFYVRTHIPNVVMDDLMPIMIFYILLRKLDESVREFNPDRFPT